MLGTGLRTFYAFHGENELRAFGVQFRSEVTIANDFQKTTSLHSSHCLLLFVVKHS